MYHARNPPNTHAPKKRVEEDTNRKPADPPKQDDWRKLLPGKEDDDSTQRKTSDDMWDSKVEREQTQFHN